MKNSLKTFIILSLVIASLEVVFVAYNYQQQKNTLEEHLQEKIQQVHSSFELAIASSYQRMTELASYVANSPAIQQAFLAGRKALAEEGGGRGGTATANARSELLALSKESWQELSSSFDFRQMHYHLPTDTTSFLRVHKPERFGEDLSYLRHTVVVAHEKQQPVSGFETGCSHSGIRGIAPVFAFDPQRGNKVFVGTLEFATSIKKTITDLAENQGVELAVLLNIELLEETVRLDVLERKIAEKGEIDGFLIEEATFPAAKSFLQKEDVRSLLGPEEMDLHLDESVYHWLASIPLRDYWGEQNPQRPDAGRIIISRDATSSVLALQENLRSNVLIAILGFIFIEIVLWLALRLTTRTLERMVAKGREELRLKNLKLEEELVEKEKLQQQREELIEELLVAAEDVKALSGLLPICSYCKKIRDDDGYWRRLETYIESYSGAQFSHGICSDCLVENFPEEITDKVCGSHLVEGTLRRK